jgi:site-specific recombinase XerD
MNAFFKRSKIISQLQVGPLGRYIADYAAQLRSEGYARETGRFKIRFVAQFSRWLSRQQFGAEQVSERIIDRFLRSRRRLGFQITHTDPSALSRMLRLLRSRSVVEEGRKPPPKASDAVLGAYTHYLDKERGLAPTTRKNYLPFVRELLDSKFGTSQINLAALEVMDIVRFVARRAPKMSVKAAQSMATALRSFLRFAQYRGDTASNLAACVPTIACWSRSTLPRALPRNDIDRVLAACNRKTRSGRRDYAVLLLLARLGLRASEISNLTLDDIDWDAGCISIRGKAGRLDKLPLPSDVGQAIAAYLKSDRPKPPETRRLFLLLKAPITGFKHHQTVGSVVKSALAKAKINSLRKGSHQFRHGLATNMLREGLSLNEIGEILRHRSPQTTAIYAKVDLPSLRQLALPWPGGAK